MRGEEFFRKAAPVHRDAVERLWIAYLLCDDERERKQIEGVLELLCYKALNDDFRRDKILLAPPDAQRASGGYPAGFVFYGDKYLYPFGLREHEWIQHVAIFGRSGSGKTNLAYVLIAQLFDKKKPFLIFDWKRNYRDMLLFSEAKETIVFTVGKDTAPFRFNPLIPPPGIKAVSWLKKLIEVVCHSYFTGEGVTYLLQTAIDRAYKENGIYSGSDEYPTFMDVLRQLELIKIKGFRQGQWWDSALRVLSTLTFGEMSKVVCCKKQFNIEELLKKQVILELETLTNSDKTFVIESLLLWIHQYRLNDQKRETFKHAIIIEEAHHILLRKKQELTHIGEVITDVILREVREFGEAIVLIDQHPSLISIPAIGNANSIFTFNLIHRLDVETSSNALLLDKDQTNYIGFLPTGQCICKISSRYPKSFLLRIPHIKFTKGIITDKHIEAHTQGYFSYSGLDNALINKIRHEQVIPAEDKKDLEAAEQPLLYDIYKNAFSAVVERYARLGLSSRAGNEIKSLLLKKGFIREIEISTKKARLKLLELTPHGIFALRRADFDIPYHYRNGLEHRFWKEKIKEHYRKQGFKVRLEKKFGGTAIDIYAEKNGKAVGIEVETGHSNYAQNAKSHDENRAAHHHLCRYKTRNHAKAERAVRKRAWQTMLCC